MWHVPKHAHSEMFRLGVAGNARTDGVRMSIAPHDVLRNHCYPTVQNQLLAVMREHFN